MTVKQGFFDLGTGETPELLKTKSAGKKQGCDACGLFRKCESPKISPTGKGSLKILLVGESPSKAEDKNGIPFSGQSGNYLKEILTELGVKMRRDCRVTNALNCRSGKEPSDREINECRSRLMMEISQYKPHVIIPMGKHAVQSVIGYRIFGRLTGVKRTAFFSEQIPDQDLKCWICPTYHPAYVLQQQDNQDSFTVLEKLWKKDLENAVKLAKSQEKIPIVDLSSCCHTTDSLEKTYEWMKDIIDNAPVTVYDYETTGIKPHAEGHEIICVSVAWEQGSFAFPFFKDKTFLSLWKNIMTSDRIPKVAQKLDFENNWTFNRAGGYYPKPYIWDTCIAAHCINSNKPKGLKFQAYVKFGVIGYDDGIDQYISKSKPGQKKSANAINKIREAPLKQLLFYNAVDSFLERKLMKWQNLQMTKSQKEGFELLMKGMESLGKAHQNGMKINVENLNDQIRKLGKILSAYEKRLMNSEEVKKWISSEKNIFNPNSDTQTSKLIYQILKYDVPEEGAKVDADTLKKINTEFIQNLLAYRKIKKLKDTYLAQFINEEVNGTIHPFFNLHIPRTFRSSSDSPNFQNIPKRDKYAKKIRSIIIPSSGNRLIEYDYKSVEVCVGACYHKDPNMIQYIMDSTTDMHRDIGMELFLKDNITKYERYLSKNGFVFPTFYGSSSFKIAPNIWEEMENSTKDHLKSKGIMNFSDFKSHVKQIETRFWNERFPVYQEWKQKIYKDYIKKGYIDLFTGFRCHGPMDFTQVTNYPIQGSAFHVLLWTLNNIMDKVNDISGRSCIIGQIHDAKVVDGHPEDENEIDNLVKLYGTKKVREHWDWIITPLKIEKERSAIDGNWSEMEECKL